MISYPAKITRDGTGYTLVFGDFPFAGHTCGKDEEEALRYAPDALRTTLSLIMEKGMDVPKPGLSSRGKGKVHMVCLSSVVENAKVELYSAMRSAGVKKAELARRMGIHKQQVERLMDIDHAWRIEQLEAAFAALQLRLVVSVDIAA